MYRKNGMKIKFPPVIVLFLLSLVNIEIFGGIFHAGPNYQLKNLESALKIISPYDTVIIHQGKYFSNNIIVNKPVVIIGLGRAVLDGLGKNQIMFIKSDDVIIENMTFINSGISFIDDNAAIKLDSVSNCKVINNFFEDNFFAIYLARTSNSTVSGNIIKAKNKKESYSGNGIHLWYSKNVEISDNRITGHRDGIYLEFVRSSNITNNLSWKNLRYGLHFMFSDSCSYSGNVFQNNGAGVAVMFTRRVEMFNNKFENNWGGAAYGVLLKEIFDSNIYNNYFYKNSNGLYMEGCNRINIKNNDFVENGWAIRLMANSMDNNFTANNFSGNSFDVSTNNIKNFNTFSGNYWSEYNGYDLNKDGIGDIPFRPVSLFSLITEQNRSSLVLLRSMFVELLNTAEKIFPVLTPETLIDNSPNIKKINHD
ncbi:MAG: nitrous oxide reductase family maturation protein NosD [Ignavibacteriae bacterium HGW-Ignavibacteriae-2]|nr:MAG: nitrous oxide reductase family maturation protein NosD [Ignavibacteriae bacterium HGW-Ignavibacteriae-2]